MEEGGVPHGCINDDTDQPADGGALRLVYEDELDKDDGARRHDDGKHDERGLHGQYLDGGPAGFKGDERPDGRPDRRAEAGHREEPAAHDPDADAAECQNAVC